MKQAQLQGYQQGFNEGRADFPRLNNLLFFSQLGTPGQSTYTLLTPDNWTQIFQYGPQATITFWWRLADNQSHYLTLSDGTDIFYQQSIYDYDFVTNYWSFSMTVLNTGACRVFYRRNDTQQITYQDIEINFTNPLTLTISAMGSQQIVLCGTIFTSKEGL